MKKTWEKNRKRKERNTKFQVIRFLLMNIMVPFLILENDIRLSPFLKVRAHIKLRKQMSILKIEENTKSQERLL